MEMLLSFMLLVNLCEEFIYMYFNSIEIKEMQLAKYK